MVKQVVVVRMSYPDGRGGSFKPRLGKLASQVAHASMKVFFDRRETLHRHETSLHVPLTSEMQEWVEGKFTKVVLGVETEEDLLRCHTLALDAGLPTALIQDIGATEFKGVPTYTAVAIGPASASAIDCITGPEGLVKLRLL